MGWLCLGLVVGSVLLFVGWVASVRIAQARHRAALLAAVRAYAEKRGGRVDVDPDGGGFRVSGPFGEGHETGRALEIMCKPGEQARWETSIGIVLRKYIPSALDEQLAQGAQKRLAQLAPEIAKLTDDALRARLRVAIVPARTPRDGLATCALPLAGRFEARVVVDGFDLDGLPADGRARLPESDDALRAHALEATLPTEVPSVDAGRGAPLAWLCRPEAIFGTTPYLVVAHGTTLAWTPVAPGDVELRLASLCQLSGERGPMSHMLFAWDGAKLSVETILVHTILGPTTPDFTLRVPSSFHATLGIHAAADGSFGVRRKGR